MNRLIVLVTVLMSTSLTFGSFAEGGVINLPTHNINNCYSHISEQKRKAVVAEERQIKHQRIRNQELRVDLERLSNQPQVSRRNMIKKLNVATSKTLTIMLYKAVLDRLPENDQAIKWRSGQIRRLQQENELADTMLDQTLNVLNSEEFRRKIRLSPKSGNSPDQVRAVKLNLLYNLYSQYLGKDRKNIPREILQELRHYSQFKHSKVFMKWIEEKVVDMVYSEEFNKRFKWKGRRNS